MVERLVERGLSEEEALAEPLDVRRFDPYPLGQRRWLPGYDVDAQVADVNRRNIRNLYQRIVARRQAS